MLDSSPAEIHLASALAFRCLVNENLFAPQAAPHLFAKHCLATILAGLDNKDTSRYGDE